MLKILNFLYTKADRLHGAFSHWLNSTTGKVIPFSEKDDGGDILLKQHSMIQGLLTARQFLICRIRRGTNKKSDNCYMEIG